jgi:hypothetical protein
MKWRVQIADCRLREWLLMELIDGYMHDFVVREWQAEEELAKIGTVDIWVTREEMDGRMDGWGTLLGVWKAAGSRQGRYQNSIT